MILKPQIVIFRRNIIAGVFANQDHIRRSLGIEHLIGVVWPEICRNFTILCHFSLKLSCKKRRPYVILASPARL